MAPPFDLKILRGTVLDGTGGPPLAADIGIAGGRVSDIGDLAAAESTETIDAGGRYVCPGFIDVHSHSDTYLLIEPAAPSKILQGITTEVVGNCGASAAPLLGQYRMPSDWADKTYPGTWRTVSEYRALLAGVRPGPNVALLVGHNTLRAGVMGYPARPAEPAELREMIRWMEQSLDEGARGLSTGLIYPPGLFAPSDEVLSLARAASARGAIYTSHMRSEGKRLLDAIAEAIAIAEQTGIRVEISHLKTSGRANWPLVDQALDLIRRARARGLPVAADRYPYTAACTDLDVILPEWAAEGGRAAVLARLRDPAARQRLRSELNQARDADYWGTVMVGSTAQPEFRGMRLPEVAERLGVQPADAALQLIESDELKTSGIFFGMSEENMWKILAEPYVMIGSDASLRAPWGPLGADHPHPRAYGSFPRFIKASLEGKTVALPEAIRKMTSLPALHFDLKGRGTLSRGAAADIVVFSPSITDRATYAQPHQFAAGVDYVLVNGVLTVAAGVLTGHRGGQFLA